MKIALVGLPNSGKTTLYNRLTGQTGDVGNRAGVTVHIHGAAIRGTGDLLFDLPGIYTLTPGTEEERVARSFLDAGYYDRILCVIDATAPERGLEPNSESRSSWHSVFWMFFKKTADISIQRVYPKSPIAKSVRSPASKSAALLPSVMH